jgi:hypothetical protein
MTPRAPAASPRPATVLSAFLVGRSGWAATGSTRRRRRYSRRGGLRVDEHPGDQRRVPPLRQGHRAHHPRRTEPPEPSCAVAPHGTARRRQGVTSLSTADSRPESERAGCWSTTAGRDADYLPGPSEAGRPATRRRWVRRRYRGVMARHAQDTPATQPTAQAAAAAATADRIQPARGSCTGRGAGWAISGAAGSSTGRGMSCAARSSTGGRGVGRAMSCGARSRTGCGTACALSLAMTGRPLQGRSSEYRPEPRVQTEAEVPDGAGHPPGAAGAAPPPGGHERSPSARHPASGHLPSWAIMSTPQP